MPEKAPAPARRWGVLAITRNLRWQYCVPGIQECVIAEFEFSSGRGINCLHSRSTFHLNFRSADRNAKLKRSFIASAISGVTGMVEFSRWLGYVAHGIILVGVGNSLAMTIRDRTREFAILKTLGFRRPQVLRLVIFEAVLSSLLGGALGAGLAWLAVNRSNFSLSVEGFAIAPHVTPELALWAVALAGVLGTVAAVLPAINASRLKIVQALREVD